MPWQSQGAASGHLQLPADPPHPQPCCAIIHLITLPDNCRELFCPLQVQGGCGFLVVTAGFLPSVWKKLKLCCRVSELCRARQCCDFSAPTPLPGKAICGDAFKLQINVQLLFTMKMNISASSTKRERNFRVTCHLNGISRTVTNLMQI